MSVKYVAASPINQTRARKERGARSGDSGHPEIFVLLGVGTRAALGPRGGSVNRPCTFP